MHTARGVARNDPAILDWLDKCPAVEKYTTSNGEQREGDVVNFTFDPSKKPVEGVPEGVFFDLSEAPF